VKDSVAQTSEIITYEADVQVVQKSDAEVIRLRYIIYFGIKLPSFHMATYIKLVHINLLCDILLFC
jgi:hypothetical protein